MLVSSVKKMFVGVMCEYQVVCESRTKLCVSHDKQCTHEMWVNNSHEKLGSSRSWCPSVALSFSHTLHRPIVENGTCSLLHTSLRLAHKCGRRGRGRQWPVSLCHGRPLR